MIKDSFNIHGPSIQSVELSDFKKINDEFMHFHRELHALKSENIALRNALKTDNNASRTEINALKTDNNALRTESIALKTELKGMKAQSCNKHISCNLIRKYNAKGVIITHIDLTKD